MKFCHCVRKVIMDVITFPLRRNIPYRPFLHIGYQYTCTCTKNVCPFITQSCVAEFEAVLRGLIFWRFLFLTPIAQNKNIRQIFFFTVNVLI